VEFGFKPGHKPTNDHVRVCILLQTIGCLRVHGDVTSLEVCHDGRTLVLGCADGSLQSYVVVDVECDEDWSSLLSRIPTRDPANSVSTGKRPVSTMTTTAPVRVWDKVICFDTRVARPIPTKNLPTIATPFSTFTS